MNGLLEVLCATAAVMCLGVGAGLIYFSLRMREGGISNIGIGLGAVAIGIGVMSLLTQCVYNG